MFKTCLVTLENKTRIAAPLKYVDENGKFRTLRKGTAKVAVGTTMTMTTNGDVNDVVVTDGVKITNFVQMDRRLSYTFTAPTESGVTATITIM